MLELLISQSVQLQSMVPSPADSSAANSPYSMNQASGDIFKMDQKPTLVPIDQQNASERLQRLMRDCGYSTDRLQNMFDELPPRKTRDDLIDHYFAAMSVLTFVLLHRITDTGDAETGLVIPYRSTSFAANMQHSLRTNKIWRTLITSVSCRYYLWYLLSP